MKPLAPNCKHIGTCAEADAAVLEFALRQGFPWRSALHNDAAIDPSSPAEPAPELAPERVHSASGIALALDCRRAWAHCYVDQIRKPEMIWEEVVAWEEWAKVHGYWSNPPDSLGIAKPVAGQRSASLGTRTHLFAQWYVTGAATADADVYGPRRLIDWESLPGQVLQSMLPLLPPAGSVAPELAEAEFELEVDDNSGQPPVKFRGLIDLLLDEVWDHKTTRDIRGYALLPDAVANAIGAPERSLKSNLQSCIYALRRARQSDPPTDAVTCRWTYGETDRSRRALQVVQEIPTAHALGVVQSAASVARTLTYATSDDAPPNTLACDKYGGCWYRGQPCKVRRDYGRIALQLEKEETDMSEKKMTFAELQKATAAANAGGKPAAAKPAPAAPKAAPAVAATKPKFTPKAPVKAAPAPEPEPEETPAEEEQTEETADETDAAVDTTDSPAQQQHRIYSALIEYLKAQEAAIDEFRTRVSDALS